MKKLLASRLATGIAAVLSIAALLSCGGGGSEGDPNLAGKPFGRRGDGGLPSFTRSAVTGLIGIVVDSTSGTPIPGVSISASGLTTTSDANGNFALPTIPNGTSVVSRRHHVGHRNLRHHVDDAERDDHALHVQSGNRWNDQQRQRAVRLRGRRPRNAE